MNAVNERQINKEHQFIDIVTKEGLAVTLCNVGASVFSIYFDKKLMTLTPKNINDFIDAKDYHGKTIGRVANRMKGDILEIDGKKYHLIANENGNILHGGKEGISHQFFTYQIKNKINQTEVIFSYLSPNGQNGFPGNMQITIKYVIYQATILIIFDAITDQKTPCSLTNHCYFNLGSKKVSDLTLKINSQKYLSVNPKTLIADSILPVSEELDFNKPKKIQNCSLDNFFYFENQKPQIVLENNEYSLFAETDFEGAQLYTDNEFDEINYFESNEQNHRALAIEPQLNHRDLHLLKPGSTFHHQICYQFKKNK